MNPPNTPPEKQQNISEIKFNDISYAIEAKTFLKFMVSFQEMNIFNQNILKITDPLPHLGFDEVVKEIKKRSPLLEKQKKEDTKEWMKGVQNLLSDLLEKTQEWIQEHKKRQEEGQLSKSAEDYLHKKEQEVEEMKAHIKLLKNLFEVEDNSEIFNRMEDVHQNFQNVEASNDNNDEQ